MNTRRRADWIAVAIVALAACLLLVRLGDRSLWWDEIINVYIERQPLEGILASLSVEPGVYHDIRPPLYHLLMHFWITIAGTSDLAMRAPSALMGSVVVALTYALGRELGSAKLGRAAAFLTAIAPGGLMYFRMGRYYALTSALALLASWIFVRLWYGRGGRLWVAYGAVALAMYYTDYLSVSVLAAHTLFALWRGLRSRRAFVVRFLGVQALVACLFLPWVPFILAQVGWAGGLVAADLSSSLLGYALKVAFPLVSFTAGETLFPWELPALASYCAFGALLVLGVVRGQMGLQRRLLLISLLVIPLLGTIGVISLVLPTLPFIGVPNRTLFALPCLNLVAASGLLSLKRRWLKVAAISIVAVVAALGVGNYYCGVNFFNPIYAVAADELVDFVLAGSQTGDIVISAEDIGFAYYLDQREDALPHYFTYSEAAGAALDEGSAPRIWWVTFGRDRTRQDEALEAYEEKLAAGGYSLQLREGHVPQDPTYQDVKETLLGRVGYEYKVVISLYAKDD